MLGLKTEGDTPVPRKSYRPSAKTVVVSVRLPLDVNAILERRAHYHPDGISGYLRDMLTFELKRDHHRERGKRARQRAKATNGEG